MWRFSNVTNIYKYCATLAKGELVPTLQALWHVTCLQGLRFWDANFSNFLFSTSWESAKVPAESMLPSVVIQRHKIWDRKNCGIGKESSGFGKWLARPVAKFLFGGANVMVWSSVIFRRASRQCLGWTRWTEWTCLITIDRAWWDDWYHWCTSIHIDTM